MSRFDLGDGTQEMTLGIFSHRGRISYDTANPLNLGGVPALKPHPQRLPPSLDTTSLLWSFLTALLSLILAEEQAKYKFDHSTEPALAAAVKEPAVVKAVLDSIKKKARGLKGYVNLARQEE